MGGQTGLNLAVALAESGVLARFGVELIGASLRAMQLAEDRQLFKETLTQAGLECPRSGLASSLEEAQAVTEEIGRFPLLIRAPSTWAAVAAASLTMPETSTRR